jgi:alanyl-tRNA synthetase
MKTKQIYLEDTYKFETDSKILEIISLQNETAIISESTIFYPQGGGQPSDLGTITCNGKKISIHKVVWVLRTI